MQRYPAAAITFVDLDRLNGRRAIEFDERRILCIFLSLPERIVGFDAIPEALSQATERLSG